MADSDTKSRLAAFYTPRELATVLTDWALTGSRCLVFDPSFGGCAFIYAALSSLRKLGALWPGRQIFGADIDVNARQYLDPVLEEGGSGSQFASVDFFSLPCGSAPWAEFDAVLGNPPYLRHHSLTQQQRDVASKALESLGVRLSARASYWAYFTVYALGFLKRGGRLALILPGAYLHADYAAPVRRMVAETFAEVDIVLLRERIFDDTDEESVIVCGKGAHLPHRALRIGSVDSVEQLAAALERPSARLHSWSTEQDANGLAAMTAPDALDALSRLEEGGLAIPAGDWAQARIGVVTGCNSYFILSRQELSRRGFPAGFARPILRRSSHVKGLTATDEQLAASYGHCGKNQLLLLPADASLPAALMNYVDLGTQTGVPQGTKCKARKPWYSISDSERPAAFLAAMTADWPRIIVNESQYTCTNNIYRLSWPDGRDPVDWLRLALGSLSSASQLSAELVGRSYGGGVLKLEPSEFSKWLIPILPVGVVLSVAHEVETALLASDVPRATEIVDTALGGCATSYDRAAANSVRAARDLLRRRRQPVRRAHVT